MVGVLTLAGALTYAELVPPGSVVANFHNTADWMKGQMFRYCDRTRYCGLIIRSELAEISQTEA